MQKNTSLLPDNIVKCGSGGGVEWKIMTWEIWKRRSGEILVNFSTFWGKLIDDLQKSDCYGLNSERKQSLTSSHGSLACVLLLLAIFWCHLVHFFSAKSILPYFSSPRGVATSVPFPEVRSRKGTESGLGTPALMCWDLFPHLELPSGAKRPKIGSPIF